MSQPIALPSTNANSTFNPASYTRHFIGSPLSWRDDHKMSSSTDDDKGSILNAFNILDAEHCRNYSCCGLHLTDLHALLEHFEEVHVVVVDPSQSHQLPQFCQDSNSPQYPPSYSHTGPFDPDDMELELDNTSSAAPSPPDTPVSPAAYSHSYYSTPRHSTCPSPLQNSPISAFETTVLRVPATAHRTTLPHPHLSAFPPSRSISNIVPAPDAFNSYAGYSDYSSSMPGTVPSPNIPEDHPHSNPPPHRPPHSPADPTSPYAGGVPPALLYSSTPTPVNTPTTSRVPSPTTPTTTTSRASSTCSRPASSVLLKKPFRCPKPNCNKTYKQANGLKYHMTHGSCNFAPPKDLEQVQALLASKRARNRSMSPASPRSPSSSASTDANVDASSLGLGMITENEFREVEREAERRLKPFACGLGDCQRRYKNMNGLRYHYQHSGDHGSQGLALLASGTHDCLKNMITTTGSPRLECVGTPGGASTPMPPPTPTLMSMPVPVQAQPQPQPQLQLQPPPPPPPVPSSSSSSSYAQQQPYGGFVPQQQHHHQAQVVYQQHQHQQQYTQQQQQQRQRMQQYQAQSMNIGAAPRNNNMGMYMGMEYGMAG